jgi:hypothetical protein
MPVGDRITQQGAHIRAIFGSPNISMEMVFENSTQVREADYDVDTGAEVRTLDRIVLSASGSIWAGVWLTGQNGPRGWTNIDLDPKFPLVGSHPFALIGRLNGRYFYVGDGLDAFHRQPPSRLQLRSNDDSPGNGSGAFTCNIQVWRRLA